MAVKETCEEGSLVHQILHLFTTKMGLEVPSVEEDLFEAGVLDSLAFVNLLVHLEADFDTQCSPEDLETDNFRTVARIADFVRRSQVPSPPPPALSETFLAAAPAA